MLNDEGTRLTSVEASQAVISQDIIQRASAVKGADCIHTVMATTSIGD